MSVKVRIGRRPPAEIVSNPEILGGEPCVAGTRAPAQTILACLEAGQTDEEIFRDYPSLPPDGIDAVRAWAASRVRSS